MQLSDPIKPLVAETHERKGHDSSKPPFILFLGKGCADAASVPDIRDVFRLVDSGEAEPETRSLLAMLLQEPARASSEEPGTPERVEQFIEFLKPLPSQSRTRHLKRLYRTLPVPTYYQDLAVLIKAGYFVQVMTTSVDTLLEQALELAGLRREYDFHVIVAGSNVSFGQKMSRVNELATRAVIIKLRGDLEHEQANLDPGEIDAALWRHIGIVDRALTGDTIMVGYQFESEPIHDWIRRTTGTLWWVSPEDEGLGRIHELAAGREVLAIGLNPEEFFASLEHGVLRAPELQRQETSMGDEQGEEPSSAGGDVSFDINVFESAKSLTEADYSEADYYREQIRRAQAVLYSIEQKVIPGQRDIGLESQIEYQRKRITELEDRLRTLALTDGKMIELLTQIVQSAQQADLDNQTLDFLQNQAGIIENECARPEPNQIVVSAAIAATTTLAEHLGRDVVSPDLVRGLASFAPNTTSQGA